MKRNLLHPVFSLFGNALLPLLALMAMAQVSFSQSLTQTVKGKILDAQSGSGLPGASIVLISATPAKGTVSNPEGEFTLNQVPVGRQTLKVTYMGYREQLLPNVLVTAGKEVVLTISLQEEVIQGQEVVVKVQRDNSQLNNEFTTLSARTFDVEQTRRFAGGRNDPARMAANFAGVVSGNDSRNEIVIRGNSPLGLLWRLEGIDIPNPSHYGALSATGGPVTILNNNTLAKSDFLTGAFPAMYGNATSGVFDLQLRSGNSSKREYTGQIGFNGFEVGAEGPLVPGRKATFLINYRYSVLGAVKKLGVNFGAGSAIPTYQDLTFKLDMPVGTPGSRFTLFGIGGKSSINLIANPKDTTNLYNSGMTNEYNQASMGVIGATYTHYLNDRTFLKFSLSGSGSTFTVKADTLNTEFAAAPYYRDQSSQGRLTGLVQFNQKLNARHTLAAGLYLHRLLYTYSDSVFYQRRIWKPLHSHAGSTGLTQAYVQWQYRPTYRLTLNSGLHGSFLALNNTYAVEPRLGLRYQVAPRQTVSFSTGLHSQQQPLQLYFQQTRLSDTQFTEMNRNLSFTRSIQTVAGYETTLGNRVRLKAETYYQHLYNVPVEQKPSYHSALNYGAGLSSVKTDSLVNSGLGRNYGLELTAERQFANGYYFLTTVSLYDSKYQGSDKIWRNTAFNGRYVGNLLAGREFRLSERNTLSIDTRLTLAGGRYYTPINLPASIQKGETVLYADQAFSQKMNDYFRADIKLTYRHNGQRLTQEWFIDFQNVTNARNIFTQNYDARAQRIRTQYQLGFFPNFNWRIEF